MNLSLSDIRNLARDEGKTEIEVITLLQIGAAKAGNEEALEALCSIKSDLIGI